MNYTATILNVNYLIFWRKEKKGKVLPYLIVGTISALSHIWLLLLPLVHTLSNHLPYYSVFSLLLSLIQCLHLG